MIYLSLINNVALIIALSIIYSFIIRRWKYGSRTSQAISGFLFGLVAIIGMMNPLIVSPGLIFDGRSIIIGVAGFIGGWVTALIAALMSIIYRIWLGGPGTIMGVSVVVSSAVIGIAYHHIRRRRPHVVTPLYLIGFGIIVHICMLALTMTLPSGIRYEVFSNIAMPVILIYPLGILLVCVLLLDIESRVHAENALRESEVRYYELFENANEAIFVAQDGKLVFLNPKTAEITGYSVEELSGKPFIGFIHPDDRDVVADRHIKRLKGEDIPHTYSFRIVHREGHSRWVELNAVLINWKSKVATLNFLNDITDRKEAEEEQKKRNIFIETILENAPIGFAVNTIHDGKSVFVSSSFESIYGAPHNSIHSVNDFFEKVYPDPVIREPIRERIMTDIATGDASRMRWENIPVTTHTGEHKIITATNIPLPEQDLMISTVQDVTRRWQAEEARRKSEAIYHDLVETSQDLIWQCDADGRYTYLNPAWERVFGYKAEEMLGKRFSDFQTPDSAARDSLEFARLMKGGYVKGYETVHIGKAGNEISLVFNAKFLSDENGNITGTRGTAYDITERKRADKALQDSEEKYRILVENASESIVVIQDGRARFVNRGIEWSGYTSEEYMSIPIMETVHPEDREAVAQRYLKKISGSATPTRHTYRALDKSGRIHWIEVSSVLIDWEGRPATLNLITDISERKQMEEALKKQLHLFERITETSPVGITLVDSDGYISFANPAAEKILGLTKNEITARVYNDPRWRIVDESGGPFPEDKFPFFRVMNTGDAVYNVRHGIEWPDGRRIILSINAAPLKDDSAGVIGMVAALQDITEHRRMEAELLNAQKLESVGILAGGIAHDFNNILAAILGNITMARMKMKYDRKILDILSAAETASMRAQGLTMQLLTFAKGGAPVKEISSIANILRETSLFVSTGSKSRCEFSMGKDLWNVEADAGQIGQVISNIVINANQAMPDGGVIQVRAVNRVIGEEHDLPLKPGRYVMITIKDQGVGIAEKHLSKIFDPYFSTKQAGRGLGLATSYSIIRKHAGHISVNSRQDFGTTFYIYLPASGKEIPVKEEAALLKGEGKILVMDDDEFLKKMMGDMLEMLGYGADFAKDGDEAIGMYRKARESEYPYAAVILDLTIPGGMGGKETIKKLLEIDPELKAMVFSGYSDDPVMSNFREYGFKGMMTKPFDLMILGKALNDVIKGYR